MVLHVLHTTGDHLLAKTLGRVLSSLLDGALAGLLGRCFCGHLPGTLTCSLRSLLRGGLCCLLSGLLHQLFRYPFRTCFNKFLGQQFCSFLRGLLRSDIGRVLHGPLGCHLVDDAPRHLCRTLLHGTANGTGSGLVDLGEGSAISDGDYEPGRVTEELSETGLL